MISICSIKIDSRIKDKNIQVLKHTWLQSFDSKTLDSKMAFGYLANSRVTKVNSNMDQIS